MKKPVEAIETLRYISGYPIHKEMATQLLAYLDSLKEWPADLTRERLIALYNKYKNPYPVKFDRPIPYDEELADALRRLAELAPKREKRKVTLWQHETDGWQRWTDYEPENYAIWLKSGWRKVGEAEIDA